MLSEKRVLLNAYFETLFERLDEQRDALAVKTEKIFEKEVAKRKFEELDEEKYAAFLDVCNAFIEERIESYNPVGVQYTFDADRRRHAEKLEFVLNWYDSITEFEMLIEMVRELAQYEMDDKQVTEIAEELISQAGAFPDKSIITNYEAAPAIEKLPDYVVALAIEEIVR